MWKQSGCCGQKQAPILHYTRLVVNIHRVSMSVLPSKKRGKGHDDNLNHSVSTAFFKHLSDWSYMLPCLSEEEEEVDGDGDGALGKTLSVGVMLGLPKPDELELLER